MNIDTFLMERNQSLHENEVEINLTESGVEPLTLTQLLSAAEMAELMRLRLGYNHTEGTPELRSAIAIQKRTGERLGRVLVSQRLVESRAMVRALSQQLGVPVVDLEKLSIDPLVIQRIPKELARACEAVPIAADGRVLDVAMADPTNEALLNRLRIELLCGVRQHIATADGITRALDRYYPE